MQTQYLGYIVMKYVGEYDETTLYHQLQVVTYDKSSYCCHTDCTVVNTPLTDTDHWFCIAKKAYTQWTDFTEGEKTDILSEITKNLIGITNDDTNGFIVEDTNGNIKLKYTSDGLDATKVSEHFLELATANMIPQTFSDVVFTNPSSKGIVPRRIGDSSVNSETFEVWESVALANDPSSWVRKSAGKYGGTLVMDFNAPNLSGINTAPNTALNAPNNTENWYFLHMNSNNEVASAVQIAIGFTTGTIYKRLKINSTYGSWQRQIEGNTLNIDYLYPLSTGYYSISGTKEKVKVTITSGVTNSGTITLAGTSISVTTDYNTASLLAAYLATQTYNGYVVSYTSGNTYFELTSSIIGVVTIPTIDFSSTGAVGSVNEEVSGTESAISVVVDNLKKSGIEVTFKNSNGFENWKFISTISNWSYIHSWRKISDNTNYYTKINLIDDSVLSTNENITNSILESFFIDIAISESDKLIAPYSIVNTSTVRKIVFYESNIDYSFGNWYNQANGTLGVGIELLTVGKIKVLVNWNALSTGSFTTTKIKLKDICYEDHYGYISISNYIATNKTDIATNKTDIATNKTDIATNKTDIATNKTDISNWLGYSPFLSYDSGIINSKRIVVDRFIVDVKVELSVTSTINRIGITNILYKKTVSNILYTQVNLRVYLTDGTHYDKFVVANIGAGVEYIKYTWNGNTIILVVDWSIFTGLTEINYEFITNVISLKDICYEDHYGYISKERGFYEYDNMFIKDRKVICNNTHASTTNTYVGKYAQVNMNTNITKVKLKFIATNQFTTTLIVTNNTTYTNVANITMGSMHVCFYRTKVTFGLYVNNTWTTQNLVYSNSLTIGKEYEVGYEFRGNNIFRLILPDSTTADYTIDGLDSVIGNIFIFEHFFSNTLSFISYKTSGYSPFTGVYCKGTDSRDILRDNFKRADGPLGVAPTGQVYKTFYGGSDATDYDNSNN